MQTHVPDESLLTHTIDEVAKLTAKHGSVVERVDDE